MGFVIFFMLIGVDNNAKSWRFLMNDLLKEAIADAKAVREIALANAKLALEEAMTPRLQSMLSQKLAEEAEGEEEEKSVEEDYGNDWFEEEPGSVSETEEETALEMGEGEEDDAEEKSEEAADDEIDIEELFGEAEDEEDAKEYKMDETDEEELDEDLMEIIRQLEEDIDSSEIGTGDNKKPSAVASDDSTEDKKEKLVQLVNEEDEEDEDIKEMMRSIREEDEEGEKEKVEEAEEDEDTVDIKEILRALREEEDEEEKVEEGEEEKEMTETKLREAYAVITFLRSKINEVNLLNSKLLFSNKLFKKHSLTEKQKITVIENFDRASSLREVKLVYATLSEALKSAKINAKPLKESFASKPIASTRPKTIINEGDDMANRLRKLAGLK
jgi:hypothetical protein